MEEQNFVNSLKKCQEIVWPVIEKKINTLNDFPEYCQVNKKYQKELDFHLEIVGDYPRRKGKYFRPTLLLLTALGMGTEEKDCLNTAAAMQISEDWILNHDDIEDDSPERRGQAALHKKYGMELAMNAGDALHIVMWQVLMDNFPILGEKKSLEIINEFEIMLNRTVLGQEIEMKWVREKGFDLSDEDNFLILESKTGYYTIAGPMRLGAILAGASKEELDKIYHFGVILGRSFQIIDDLLDLTSDFAGLKKRGNDIYENKRTIMLLHLYREAKGVDKEKLIEILNKKREEKNESDVDYIVKLMEKYGSLKYGFKLAEKFTEEAKNIFHKELTFIKKEPYRSQIEAGIDFVAKRDH